jgi:hypothetical protein
VEYRIHVDTYYDIPIETMPGDVRPVEIGLATF